ncbi:MAG: NUDIX domain-containing protein [Candidatus Pacebacteria bacterium]|nr:NUDIX domain-containing protein [Candidatus Paceibacterota bacterium]
MGNKPKKTISAGGVVINHESKILVCSQCGTSWSLPKGHMEPGETPIDAAKREINEESGISQRELICELGSYQRYKIGKDGGEDTSELKKIIMFLFKTSENNLKPIDPKNPEARWVPKKEVAELLTHKKDKEFFIRISKEI